MHYISTIGYLSEPSAVAYDYVAEPNTIIVADHSHSVISIYYVDGTFYKLLVGGFVSGPEGMTVDPIYGYLFVTDYSANNVLVYSPYPNYQYTTSLSVPTGPITNYAFSYSTYGLYIAIACGYVIEIYQLNIENGNNPSIVNISLLLVGSTPSSSTYGYTYGGIVDPNTQQLTQLINSNPPRFSYYNMIYHNATSVSLTLNRTYTGGSSGLPYDVDVNTYTIDKTSRVVVYDGNNDDLYFLYSNGQTIIPPIATGLQIDTYYGFISGAPDGSIIIIADPFNARIAILQGFYPTSIYSNIPSIPLLSSSSSSTGTTTRKLSSTSTRMTIDSGGGGSNDNDNPTSLSGGAVAGVSVGVIVVILVIPITLVLYCRHRRITKERSRLVSRPQQQPRIYNQHEKRQQMSPITMIPQQQLYAYSIPMTIMNSPIQPVYNIAPQPVPPSPSAPAAEVEVEGVYSNNNYQTYNNYNAHNNNNYLTPYTSSTPISPPALSLSAAPLPVSADLPPPYSP